MSHVVLTNVTKMFDQVCAVDNISLAVEQGEFMVLVGPSGCGKSTTLRMIAGLEQVTHGTIRIGDRVVNHIPPKDRDIAMVFQNYALYPHMTVYNNMAFGLKLRKFKKADIDSRVREAAAILNIADLLQRKPKQLSGGQRQRVAVGRAIVRKPEVFLFDEPLSNLDAKMRVQMRVEISRLHTRLGATMIYVTHDQTEAMTMGDRIVVMKHGLVQQIADPIRLYDRPVNKFVAGFIGTPPMNFFNGTLKRENGGLRFEGHGLCLPLPENLKTQEPDREITLGLRPEDIGAGAAEADANLPRIAATVEVIEPVGAETYLHLRAGEHRFISRVDAHRRFRVGDKTQLAVFNANVRLFDPNSELAID